jgi:hypothetical protein
MEKTFGELAVGQKFSINGSEYVKVEAVRISCCQSINAHLSDNPGARVFFTDNLMVTVNA